MRKAVEQKEFDEEVLTIDRVTRVNTGGRRMRFRAVVVVGDRKGKIGLGTGKANEVVNAVQKATRKAKHNLRPVIIRQGTIPHDIEIKYKSSHILLKPAGEGTGIIAGSVIRKILALAGYKNILSKMFGTSNKLLNSQATFMALSGLQERPLTAKEKELLKQTASLQPAVEKKPEPVPTQPKRNERRREDNRKGSPGRNK